MYYDYPRAGEVHPFTSHACHSPGRRPKSVLYFLIETDRAPCRSHRHPAPRAPPRKPGRLDPAARARHRRLLVAPSRLQHPGRTPPRTEEAFGHRSHQRFRDNLHHLLLAPPAGPISVLGLDPGLRTGCKVAVVDETGRFLAQDVIYPHTGQTAKANATLATLVKAHNVRAIAIGNAPPHARPTRLCVTSSPKTA